jgi:hypothetical protein
MRRVASRPPTSGIAKIPADDVRLKAAGHVDPLAPVGRFPNHFKLVRFQHGAKAAPKQRVIVAIPASSRAESQRP